MTDTNTSKVHALHRTSPKGQPFVGTCIQCGDTMPLADMHKTPCQNHIALSEGDAIKIALGNTQ